MGDSFGSQIPNIGGMRKHWNQVTVDGLNGNELSGTNRMNSSINLDAIAEVKVLLNTYKAEFGHSGGANIEIVSKSGSSTLRRIGLLVRQARRVECDAVGEQSGGPAEAEAARRHAGIQSRRSRDDPGPVGSEVGQEALLLLLVRRAAGAASRSRASLPHADGARAAGRFLPDVRRERASDQRQGSAVLRGVQRHHRWCRLLSGATGFPRIVSTRTRWPCSSLMPLPEYDQRQQRLQLPASGDLEQPALQPSDPPRHRPSGNNTIWGSLRTWRSSQYGSEITAGPAKWGFFDGSYVSGDNSVNGGWNHVLGSNGVNELSAGCGVRPKGSARSTTATCDHILKSSVGYTLGQFTDLNTLGASRR